MKAPFNFVPLSEKVYFPDWAAQISQDIPFSDSTSGIIELKIKAQSPIFVRNGHTRDDAESKNTDYKSFSHIDDRYFIPATTVKGTLRNVLEILSFSKMSRIDNKRYSIRDLHLQKYKDDFKVENVHCGWMSKIDSTITITDAGIPGRISYTEIDSLLGTNFETKFASNLKEEERSPLFKYRLIENNPRIKNTLTYKFKKLPLNPDNIVDERKVGRKQITLQVILNPDNIVDKRIKVKSDLNGEEGTIVFTGQSSPRKEATGKFYDFVFFKETGRSFQLEEYDDQGLYKDFCFVNKDSEIWKYWKKKLDNKGKIPVFFTLKNDQIAHFGLSYLYKLPYPKRIKGYLYDQHKSESMDLSECIFGCTNQQSLRGRIQISNAFLESGKPMKESLVYLGSPKPTYYPIYLKQKGTNGYMGQTFKTMLSEDSKLKGWKRYPVHQEVKPVEYSIPQGQEKNANPFIPICPESEFKCKIRFHNLKKIELGALLRAIEFSPNGFHTIGFAKPFGYGKVKINIEKISSYSHEEIEQLKKLFDEHMNTKIPNYSNSEQIKELRLMSIPQDLNVPLSYMELQDFADIKKQKANKEIGGEYLQPYSAYIKQKVQQNIKTSIEKALVSVFSGQIKQAKLLEGKDTKSYPLTMGNKKDVKLKMNAEIEVEVVYKDGKIKELKFSKLL